MLCIQDESQFWVKMIALVVTLLGLQIQTRYTFIATKLLTKINQHPTDPHIAMRRKCV